MPDAVLVLLCDTEGVLDGGGLVLLADLLAVFEGLGATEIAGWMPMNTSPETAVPATVVMRVDMSVFHAVVRLTLYS